MATSVRTREMAAAAAGDASSVNDRRNSRKARSYSCMSRYRVPSSSARTASSWFAPRGGAEEVSMLLSLLLGGL